MSKEYTPFYDGLEEKYKEYYMEWSKEVLIDHMVANIHNADVLLKRIESAIDYIEGEMSHHTSNGRLTRAALIQILKGERKYEVSNK